MIIEDFSNDNTIDIDLNEEDTVEAGSANSARDALVLCISSLGRVDLEWIARATGLTKDEVIVELKGVIFQNPETWNNDPYCGWEIKDEYVSGNLIRKYKDALNANKAYPGRFALNVRVIKAILPEKTGLDEVYVTLGSPWIPTSIIERFINQLLGTYGTRVDHNEITGSWSVHRGGSLWNPKATNTYGTSRIDAYRIISNTLNGRDVVVKDTIHVAYGKNGTKVNQSATNLALEKQKLIVKAFNAFVTSTPDVEDELTTIYYRKFGCTRKRVYDGSFLELPTLSKDVTLFPYQKDAVARMIFSPNTLLAHDVGSGKTYEMIAAGMELKRMGLSSKNLYTVPNGIINQWRTVFKKMYPDAKVLVVRPSSFTPSNRNAVLENIRDNDYDAIIMPHSCFDQIAVSADFEYDELIKRRDALVISMNNAKSDTTTVKARINALDKKIAALAKKKEPVYGTCLAGEKPIAFEELGITRLFVDEAHNYKNVPFDTKMNFVSGLNPSGSEKCKRMLLKVRAIQKANGGSGVVMATGTPITNSISDCFIMQNYLQKGELDLLGIADFDAWCMMFAEVKHEFEISVDTNTFKIGTRFGKFHNLPELSILLSNIADFHHINNSDELPQFNGYTDVKIAKTPYFQSFLDEISHRADRVRNGSVKRERDNMLKITTDGRKAALDLRLLDKPHFQPLMQSKAFECARNVASVYFKTIDNRSTQLVFCDTSTPRQGFNMYNEIKDLLVSFRIPEEQIAFIHDYESETKRNKLFDQVNKGEIRIVIGSTPKLGTGVNVQERLVAIHHVDVPWRPSEMVQREGRIIRPGNTSKEVNIYRYITENSFDAYSWQLLESKQTFISKLLSCSVTERDADDIDDSVLNYAEVKALAIGNPLVKERVEAYNTLQRYKNLNQKAKEERQTLQYKVYSDEQRLPVIIERLAAARKDLTYLKSTVDTMSADEKKDFRERIYSDLRDNLDNDIAQSVADYRGFEIWSPESHTVDSTYIYLKREGSYRIDMSTSPLGLLVRIDNFLDKFERTERSYEKDYDDTVLAIEQTKKELKRKTGYTKEIGYWTDKLATLDKKLGLEDK